MTTCAYRNARLQRCKRKAVALYKNDPMCNTHLQQFRVPDEENTDE